MKEGERKMREEGNGMRDGGMEGKDGDGGKGGEEGRRSGTEEEGERKGVEWGRGWEKGLEGKGRRRRR